METADFACCSPTNSTVPVVGVSRRPMMCNNVVLPQPVGPMMPKNSRSRTSRLTPPIARTSPWLVVYTLVNPRTTTFMLVMIGIAFVERRRKGDESSRRTFHESSKCADPQSHLPSPRSFHGFLKRPRCINLSQVGAKFRRGVQILQRFYSFRHLRSALIQQLGR